MSKSPREFEPRPPPGLLVNTFQISSEILNPMRDPSRSDGSSPTDVLGASLPPALSFGRTLSHESSRDLNVLLRWTLVLAAPFAAGSLAPAALLPSGRIAASRV